MFRLIIFRIVPLLVLFCFAIGMVFWNKHDFFKIISICSAVFIFSVGLGVLFVSIAELG